MPPLLRWAGSKRGLLSEMLTRLPPRMGRYVEPFAGSACLFFSLRPEKAILGDRNMALMRTYELLRERPLDVGRQVHSWGFDRSTYLAIRAEDESRLGPVERAARFIYLNRLCFNGIYRTNRHGQFNVPYGQRPGAMPSLERFLACGTALEGARLMATDFEAAVRMARRGDFFYLDPPYSRAASDNYGVYGYGSFQAEDLDRFVSCLEHLHSTGAAVLVSYRLDEALTSLGPPWNFRTVSVRSQVGGRSSSRGARPELLLANYDISDRAVGVRGSRDG